MQRLRRVGFVLALVVLSHGIALGQAHLSLRVVDSNGQKVGYATGSAEAVIFIDGEAFAIEVTRDGFRPTGYFLFSAAADCSDPQYVYMYNGGLASGLYSYAWFTSDGVLHYPSTSSAQVIAIQSGRNVLSDGSIGPCYGTTGSVDAAPPLSAPAPAFTPPFSVVDTLEVSAAPATASFNDVPTNHPFFKFIEALKASGITAGCSAAPPLYCPDAPLTRGQMAVFLSIALGL